MHSGAPQLSAIISRMFGRCDKDRGEKPDDSEICKNEKVFVLTAK